MTTSRGIRNNNPGNIRWGDEWKGLVAGNLRTDSDFCQFTAPEMGIRAIVVILLKYGTKAGTPGIADPRIDTVREIINRWAPPNENDTEAYVNSVAEKLMCGPNTHIDLGDRIIMCGLVKAIIRHENGAMPYTNIQIETAMTAAGLA